MLVRRPTHDAADARARVQRYTRCDRALEYTRDVLERVIRAVAGNEAAEERILDSDFLANPPTRPQLDALSVLCGKQHLVAHPLLLLFGARKVQPAARREVAFDVLMQDDRLERIAIAQAQAEHDRRLPLAFSLDDFLGKTRIASGEECFAFARQAFVDADRVLWNELEVPAVSSARFAAGISLIEYHHPVSLRMVGEMIRCGCAHQTSAD